MKHICKVIIIFIFITAVSCSNPLGSRIRAEANSILYIRQSQDFKELAAMRPDGSLIKVILRYEDSSSQIDVARWSPDKTLIVLEGGPIDKRGFIRKTPLWIINNNGTFVRKLTTNGHKPVWSRDGEKIFFVKDFGNIGFTQNVYSINSDGTNERVVYQTGVDISFHITDDSVSGEYLFGYEAFTFIDTNGKQSVSNTKIVRIDLKTGEKIFLTENEFPDFAPRLSNKGNKLAYYHQEYKERSSFKRITNLHILNSDDQNSQKITNFTSFNLAYPHIAWSPDSNFLGFSKIDQINKLNTIGDIYTVDINTGLITQLTNTININEMIMDWK